MNILHHKSWHVRNKNNIERVRKDEEKAAQEEEDKQRRVALAEQEARTDLLRQKARIRSIDSSDTSLSVEHQSSQKRKHDEVEDYQSLTTDIYTGGHINFFSGEHSKDKKNAEHEKEKNKEKEEWEKKVGILTYLGQSSAEGGGTEPWYVKKRKTEASEETFNSKDKKLKDILDPLHDMKDYVKKKKHKHTRSSDKHKKHKQHKEKEKEKEHEAKAQASKSMEKLRAERLRREQEEQKRTRLLLAKSRGEKLPSDPPPTDDRDRRYNSQYNPQLSRKH